MLLISIVLGLIPLAGIAWIVISGTMTTVDGLFEILIMLSSTLRLRLLSLRPLPFSAHRCATDVIPSEARLLRSGRLYEARDRLFGYLTRF